MDAYIIFSLLGAVAASVAVAISVIGLIRKLNAREELVRKLSHDKEFVAEVKKFYALAASDEVAYRDEIERLQKIITARIKELNNPIRDQIEAPLHQSSSIGRVRYIKRIANSACAKG